MIVVGSYAWTFLPTFSPVCACGVCACVCSCVCDSLVVEAGFDGSLAQAPPGAQLAKEVCVRKPSPSGSTDFSLVWVGADARGGGEDGLLFDAWQSRSMGLLLGTAVGGLVVEGANVAGPEGIATSAW